MRLPTVPTMFLPRFALIAWLTLNTATAFGQAQVETKAKTEAESTTVPVPKTGRWMDLHEQFLERAKQGDIDLLFLGDSITAQWNSRDKEGQGPRQVWDRYYGPRHAANFGIGGDRTQHVLWRLENGEIDGIKPRVVVLMIGTNNLGANTQAEIADGITLIVKKLRAKLPDTRILLLGVFPRGEKPAPVRDRIKDINERISKLDDGSTVRYLDIGARFLNEDGTISPEIMPDFLHLKRKGYSLWADAIEPTLRSMLEGNCSAWGELRRCPKRNPPPVRKPRRLRLVLSVRTLMLLVLLVGGWLGWQVRRANVQKRAVAQVKKAHGDIIYEYPYPGGFRNSREDHWAPAWLRKAIGDAYFQEVKGVTFYNINIKFEGNSATFTSFPESEAVTDAQIALIKPFDRLESVIIHSPHITDAALAVLGRIPSLREIELQEMLVTDVGLAHLKPLKRLRKLVLHQFQDGFHLISTPEEKKIDAEFFPELMDHRLTPREANRLKWVRLHKHITDAGLANLAGMTELQELSLQARGITDAGLVHLAALTDLRTLNLSNTGINGAGLVHLKAMSRLREVSLGNSSLNSAGLAHLAGLSELRKIHLGNTEITDAGLEHLKGLRKLERPQASSSIASVTDAGLVWLKDLKNLRTLDLRMTGIKGPGLVHLSGLTALKTLHLPSNQTITDADLAHLKGLTALEELDLDGNPITDAGLAHLQGLTRLRKLNVNQTKVSDDGVTALTTAIPKVKVAHDPRSELQKFADRVNPPAGIRGPAAFGQDPPSFLSRFNPFLHRNRSFGLIFGVASHIACSSAKGWAGPSCLGLGRACRMAAARRRSAAVVILRFIRVLSTTAHGCPIASTSCVSSVTAAPSRPRLA